MRCHGDLEIEGLFAGMDGIKEEAREHLLQAKEEPSWGGEPFPAQQWTAFVDALFGIQNHLTALYGALKAAEADRTKYQEVYARNAGEGGPTYERLGSDQESDRNPLLIADEDMFGMLERLHATMIAVKTSMQRMMHQTTYTEADLGVEKPIHFEEIVEALAARFQSLLGAAHHSCGAPLSRESGTTPREGPAYPNQKVCANYMLHRSLRNITTEFYRMEVALQGLGTVAASIYINPGAADPSLAAESTYGNKRSF